MAIHAQENNKIKQKKKTKRIAIQDDTGRPIHIYEACLDCGEQNQPSRVNKATGKSEISKPKITISTYRQDLVPK